MNSVLGVSLPADLRRRRLRNPAFFHVRDLTHLDILTLGRKLVAKFPDRGMPILITGTRTAGSYFAPLLRAYLKNEGYRSIDVVTMRPKNGLSGWERRRLAGSARQGGLGVIVDEPAMTGSTLLKVAAILVKAGVPQANVVALNPVHPTTRDWRSAPECLPLAKLCIVSLEPEEWHKYQLLEADTVAGVLGGPLIGLVLDLSGGTHDATAWNVVFVIVALEYVAAALCWLAIDSRTPLAPLEDRR